MKRKLKRATESCGPVLNWRCSGPVVARSRENDPSRAEIFQNDALKSLYGQSISREPF